MGLGTERQNYRGTKSHPLQQLFLILRRSPETTRLPVLTKRKYAARSNLSPVSISARMPSPFSPNIWPPSATPCLWSIQHERNCVQTIARERQPLTLLTFLSPAPPHPPHQTSSSLKTNHCIAKPCRAAKAGGYTAA